MIQPLHRQIADSACDMYRPAGPWAWRFARGKLRGDPLFATLLTPGLLPPSARILDLGCGQGLLAAWLDAAAGLHARARWPAQQRPPPRLTGYHGVDMFAAAVASARQALAGSPFPVHLEVADLCAFAVPEASVVTLFDVLHYLPAAAQEALLQRIHDSLPPDGRLLLRIGDAAAGWPQYAARLVDGMVVLAQCGRLPRLHCRRADDWLALLERLGFRGQTHPMTGASFANVLIVARRT